MAATPQSHRVVPAGSEDTGLVADLQSWPGRSQVFLGGLPLGRQGSKKGDPSSWSLWALGGSAEPDLAHGPRDLRSRTERGVTQRPRRE